MNIVIMGPPGVGKGTQGLGLATKLGIPLIASGDMFRAIRSSGTELGGRISKYLDQGEYVPDELTIELVFHRLHEPDALRGFVLDGFPRTVTQARALDKSMHDDGRKIDKLIMLDAAPEVLLQRLAHRQTCTRCGHAFNEESRPPKIWGICDECGGELAHRSDESPEVLRHRLEVYNRQTAPVVEFYENSHRLVRVDATGPVDQIQGELLERVGIAVAV